MNNNLVDAMAKTAETLSKFQYVNVTEMDAMDQLYFMGAYMKFAKDLEPLTKKYVGSNEKLDELKIRKAKENADKFADILALFSQKENGDVNSDNNTDTSNS